MKQVTQEVVAEADRRAAQAVEEAVRDGRVVDAASAYYVHKAAWAAVTGADAVQVVAQPAGEQSSPG